MDIRIFEIWVDGRYATIVRIDLDKGIPACLDAVSSYSDKHCNPLSIVTLKPHFAIKPALR